MKFCFIWGKLHYFIQVNQPKVNMKIYSWLQYFGEQREDCTRHFWKFPIFGFRVHIVDFSPLKVKRPKCISCNYQNIIKTTFKEFLLENRLRWNRVFTADQDLEVNYCSLHVNCTLLTSKNSLQSLSVTYFGNSKLANMLLSYARYVL